MFEVLKIQTTVSELRISSVNKDEKILYDAIRNDLSISEKKFYDNITLSSRKCEWLTVRILLKQILGKYSEIKYDSFGKPYIKGDYNISISHSKDLAGVFVSYNKDNKIGFDIERFSEKIERIAEKFMKIDEFDFIIDDSKADFIRINWSAKESIYKLHGTGNLDFKENMEVPHFELKKQGAFECLLKLNASKPVCYKMNYKFIEVDINNILSKYLVVWTNPEV